jgi:hypothetical protein
MTFVDIKIINIKNTFSTFLVTYFFHLDFNLHKKYFQIIYQNTHPCKNDNYKKIYTISKFLIATGLKKIVTIIRAKILNSLVMGSKTPSLYSLPKPIALDL